MGRFAVVLKNAWDEYSGKQNISGGVWKPRGRWLGMIKGVTRMRLVLKEQVLKFSQWDGASGWDLGREMWAWKLSLVSLVSGMRGLVEDGYLWGFYGLKGIFSLCFLQERKQYRTEMRGNETLTLSSIIQLLPWGWFLPQSGYCCLSLSAAKGLQQHVKRYLPWGLALSCSLSC